MCIKTLVKVKHIRIIKIMNKNISLNNNKFFKALSSKTKVNILETLISGEKNIGQISKALDISNVTIWKHINELEDAGIIRTKNTSAKKGVQKVCTLIFKDYHIKLTTQDSDVLNTQQYEIPVGSYSNYDVYPTCGLASTTEILDECDNSRYFSRLNKNEAGILWFSQGWLEYTIPSYLVHEKTINKIELILELSVECSEFKDTLKSDIYFSWNGVEIAKHIATVDTNKEKGIYTPGWWILSQYGETVALSITKRGTFINHIKISDVSILDININDNQDNILKIASPKDTENPGGLHLFGQGFGNFNNHILLKTYHY